MEARVILTKETKEKMEKGLNLKQKRELRINKLKELDEEGKLSRATCRLDITKMLGFSGGYDAGYTWVSSIVKEGILEEVFLGFDKNGKPEYEYHVKNVPQLRTTVAKAKALSGAVVSHETYANTDNANSNTTTAQRMVIKYKDLTIELDNINPELVESIVNKLADK